MNSYSCNKKGHADCGRCPKCHYCGLILRKLKRALVEKK